MLIQTVTSAVTAAVSVAFQRQNAGNRKRERRAESSERRVEGRKEDYADQPLRNRPLGAIQPGDSVRMCGIAETDNEKMSDIVVNVAKDMGIDISPDDMSVSHRVGGPRRGCSYRPQPILATFVLRD